MRYTLILPLILVACDSGTPDPATLDLSGDYVVSFATTAVTGTATWEVRGNDVTLHVEPGDELVDAHTLRGTYFSETNDMRLTGTFTGPEGWGGDAVWEASVTFGGERVEGRWTGTYPEDYTLTNNPRIETLRVIRAD